jgi:hypothetical protein
MGDRQTAPTRTSGRKRTPPAEWTDKNAPKMRAVARAKAEAEADAEIRLSFEFTDDNGVVFGLDNDAWKWVIKESELMTR